MREDNRFGCLIKTSVASNGSIKRGSDKWKKQKVIDWGNFLLVCCETIRQQQFAEQTVSHTIILSFRLCIEYNYNSAQNNVYFLLFVEKYYFRMQIIVNLKID